MRASRILREVRSGKVASCVKLNLIDSRVVELCGLSGFSAVWMDNEHVPNDWLNLEHMIRAARLYDMDAIVRVAKGDYSDLIKPFEAGAQAIMVPHVESAAEAKKIVEMTRFHPSGKRPLDGGNVDGRFCQIPLLDYLDLANREQLVILQIESMEAVQNVHEIAAVPGFDCLLFGPGDFSHRIGLAGEIHSEVVSEARRAVEIAAKENNKFCMAVGYREDPQAMFARGYGIASLGADVVTLGDGFRRIVEDFDNSPPTPAAQVLYGSR